MRTPDQALKAAIKAAGNQAALARRLGIKAQSINDWNRTGKIPVQRAKQIDAEFGIPKHELRPDVFDPPADVAA